MENNNSAEISTNHQQKVEIINETSNNESVNQDYLLVESLKVPDKSKNFNNSSKIFKVFHKRSNSLPMDHDGSTTTSGSTFSKFTNLFGRKNSQEAKSIKNKLSQEGKKHVSELVNFLYADKSLVKKKVELENDDLLIVSSIDKAVDLEKYFEPKEKNIPQKPWIIPFSWFIKEEKDNQQNDISSNNYKVVNRFGDGVLDGCGITLSLPADGRDVARFISKELEWDEIVQEADDTLDRFDSIRRKQGNFAARRGSIFQPRIMFVSPQPEKSFDKICQTANCLPLREWTSELFLQSKESLQLLDIEEKRNLKWNVSVEDFRHLLSPELSHFGSDLNSVLINAKRRFSVFSPGPNTVSEQFKFRRSSFRNNVWSPQDTVSNKKKDYKKRLQKIRRNVITSNKQKLLSVKSVGSMHSLMNRRSSLSSYDDGNSLQFKLLDSNYFFMFL